MMLEIIVLVLGILILLSLRRAKSPGRPEASFYFNDELALPPEREGTHREFQFYTFAEFNETREIGVLGTKKTLGFSKFPLIYDCKEERVKTARVAFSAADGFSRLQILGLLDYLNEEEDWLEIDIRLSTQEYDMLFQQLENCALTSNKLGRYFLLYEISVELGVITKSKRSLNIIKSIRTVKAYHESDAHKIRLMIKLDEGRRSSESRYSRLCEEHMRYFNECLGG